MLIDDVMLDGLGRGFAVVVVVVVVVVVAVAVAVAVEMLLLLMFTFNLHGLCFQPVFSEPILIPITFTTRNPNPVFNG